MRVGFLEPNSGRRGSELHILQIAKNFVRSLKQPRAIVVPFVLLIAGDKLRDPCPILVFHRAEKVFGVT